MSRRERFLRVTSWLVLVFALLPAITYFGHWPAMAGGGHHDDSSASAHQVHCHGSVSSCAGSEAMVGTVWAGEDTGVLSLTSPDRYIETRHTAAPVEGLPSLLLQPPRAI
jgi:hypothetical protein